MMEEWKKKTRKRQKKRIDKISNTKKVAKVIIKNPNLSQTQLAKQAWVSQGTVSNAIKELTILNKNPLIVEICKKDLEIITVAQELALEKLMDQEYNKKIRISEIASLISDNTRRYSLFKWDITDPDGWTKTPISPEQFQKLLDRFELDE